MATEPLRVYSQLSKPESVSYREAYYATLDLVEAARAKFLSLSMGATSLSAIGAHRAKALEAARLVELLKNQYRDFLRDEVPVKPPGPAALRQLRLVHERVNASSATEAAAPALDDDFHRGLHLFAMLQGG